MELLELTQNYSELALNRFEKLLQKQLNVGTDCGKKHANFSYPSLALQLVTSMGRRQKEIFGVNLFNV